MHGIRNAQFLGPNTAGGEIATSLTFTTRYLAAYTPVSWAVLNLVWDVIFSTSIRSIQHTLACGPAFLSDLCHVTAGSVEAWHWLHTAPSKHSSLSQLSTGEGVEGRGGLNVPGIQGQSLSCMQSRASTEPPGSWNCNDFPSGDPFSSCVTGNVMHRQCEISVNLSGLRRREKIIEWNYK